MPKLTPLVMHPHDGIEPQITQVSWHGHYAAPGIVCKKPGIRQLKNKHGVPPIPPRYFCKHETTPRTCVLDKTYNPRRDR